MPVDRVDEYEQPLTIRDALREATNFLREAGVAEPRRDAGSLLAHATKCDRTFLITHPEHQLSKIEYENFSIAIKRRAAGEPVQYIRGEAEFYGLTFRVTPDVLIPRPETELIIETALDLLKRTNQPLAFCDVGTGSGCITIALLHELNQLRGATDARGVSLDISTAALQIAVENAERHQVREQIRFIVSDCFAALYRTARFTLVVSNPPYVAERDIQTLQREVRLYEPHTALTSGGGGTRVIRRLLADAPRFLVPGGHLVFEIGYDQSDAVRELVDERVWQLIEVRNDLQNIPRTFVLRLR